MIVHAAILCPDGVVVSGADMSGYPYIAAKPRHHDIINFLVEIMGYPEPIGGSYEQGFITDTGQFLDRVEAMNHAVVYGQVNKDDLVHSGVHLFSEDLW